MDRSAPLRVRLRLDRDYAGPEGTAFLVVEVLASPSMPTRPNLRRPLDLVLAVDASRSMSEAFLPSARRIVARMAQRLSPCDRLTVISFAGDLVLHLDRMPMDGVGRTLAIKTSRELLPRCGSNIGKGWFEGALRILKGSREGDGVARRVVVISDGHADRGIREPGELAGMAADLRSAGLCTSAIGMGNRCHTAILTAICEAGGGRLHFTDQRCEITEASMAELLDNRNPTAREVELELSPPSGVTIENTGASPEVAMPGRTVYPIGPLVPGGVRDLIFRVRIVSCEPGSKVRFRAAVRYRRPRVKETLMVKSNWAFLDIRKDGGRSSGIADTVLSHRIAHLWRSGLVRQVVASDYGGDRFGETEPLRDNLLAFRSYCEHISGTGNLLDDLDHAVCASCFEPGDRPSHGLVPVRKAGSRQRHDYRSLRRTAWSTCLNNLTDEDDLSP